MFRQLNSLAFRELVIESNVIASYGQGAVYDDAADKMKALQPPLEARKQLPRVTRLIEEGSHVYRAGEYGTSFFTVLAGEVTLENPDPAIPPTTLKQGQFFGETSLLSGRPRLESALAGADCILVETPRRIMIKLMNSNEEVRRGIDWIFIVRLLQRSFAPSATVQQLGPIADRVKTRQLKAGEKLFEQDKPGTTMHLIRSGAVTLARAGGGQNLVIAELRTGELVGEMALMGDPVRRESATAAVATETIEIGRDEFVQLVELGGAYIARILDRVKERQTGNAQMEVRPEAGSLMRFLMGIGLGEATDALVIDESLCIGCDNCEKACAETHGGISRLDRKGGDTHANVHVPIACRHCEQPHCMKDCPPNAIHRAPNGQVYIDDTCIGCGNCKENCPYGVIRMEYAAPKKPALLSWLLFGRGPGPGEVAGFEPDTASQKRGKKAVKCDACMSVASGPACVSSCPTGAAKRIGPERFIDLVERRSA
jgi:Fe-S-cluster-containing hydrogenase component 2/CRP-like cAMP-binding protein